MKPSKVYRKAATLINAKGREFSCHAISIALNYKHRHTNTIEARLYSMYFKPEDEAYDNAWWTSDKGTSNQDDDNRIFALLLMAEIVEEDNYD